jgi:hypothetical protein
MAVVRRLSLWLLVLPLLAQFADSGLLERWGLRFALPFTWGLLYSAAVIFLVSSAPGRPARSRWCKSTMMKE